MFFLIFPSFFSDPEATLFPGLSRADWDKTKKKMWEVSVVLTMDFHCWIAFARKGVTSQLLQMKYWRFMRGRVERGLSLRRPPARTQSQIKIAVVLHT